MVRWLHSPAAPGLGGTSLHPVSGSKGDGWVAHRAVGIPARLYPLEFTRGPPIDWNASATRVLLGIDKEHAGKDAHGPR